MHREIFLLTVLLAVVGGMKSRLGEYPSLVLIFKKEEGRFVCAGDLITNQHVASAAHCYPFDIELNSIYIMAGSNNLLSSRRKFLFVKEIISHPGYKQNEKRNDYAILVLTEPVEENKYIKAVKLSNQRPAPGTKCTVTGWGFEEVKGVKNDQAFKEYVYVSTREQCPKRKGMDDASTFCAGVQKGAQEGGIDACKGDRGGPLFCNDELAGIASWDKCRLLPEYPRVYSDVSAQRDWFTRQIAKTSSSRKKGKNQSSVSSAITSLIVRQTHERYLHCGVSTLLSMLRERFWIPKGRPLVKDLIKRCITCHKLMSTPKYQPFKPLPKERIVASRPFETVGVDFAGPLYVKYSTGDTLMKCFILLLTCAVTRAVHLELVTTLATENFLTAFRRFIARRGIPKVIFSDNTKTFKQASSELKNLDTTIIRSYLNEERIEWRFIVERAPWWGGFWERMVRSVKTLLKTVIGKRTLDLDQMSTLLCEAEGIINARLLTYVAEDVDNVIPLTPAHFLLGYREVQHESTPEIHEHTSDLIRKRWQQRLKLTSSLWKRWKIEYLRQLRQHHTSANTSTALFNPGQVVLVYDHTKLRIHWKLATIENIFPGRDGLVRACEVRFANGLLLRRSVQHLYVLEVN